MLATGVKAIFPVTDMGFIETALDAVFTDVGVDAIKTGRGNFHSGLRRLNEWLLIW
jgi:hydroxymethylpyrimidine/phosphomethylpyrimidine kinase